MRKDDNVTNKALLMKDDVNGCGRLTLNVKVRNERLQYVSVVN